MALVALRDISLGEHEFARDDIVPPAVQMALPPGRVEALKAQRYLEERDETQEVVAEIASQLEALAARVKALEAAPRKQQSSRKPKEATA